MAHHGTTRTRSLTCFIIAASLGCSASSEPSTEPDANVADTGGPDAGAPDAAVPTGTIHVDYLSPFPNTDDGTVEVTLAPLAAGVTRLAVIFYDEGNPRVADDGGVTHLALDLDTAALVAGHTFVLDGAVTLDTTRSGSASGTPPWDTSMTVAFVPAGAADAAVRRVAFYHGCHCDQVNHYEQTVSGTLELDAYDGAAASGTIHLAIEGGIPAYSLAPNARLTVDVTFAGAAVTR